HEKYSLIFKKLDALLDAQNTTFDNISLLPRKGLNSHFSKYIFVSYPECKERHMIKISLQ
ncbi:MAG: hypothetical protein CK425_11110, partial [Parachlamydia sp.]